MNVSLRTPWQTLDGDIEEAEDSTRTVQEKEVATREGDKVLTRKRMSLLMVTSEDADDQEVESEVNDELVEFSFTGDQPPT